MAYEAEGRQLAEQLRQERGTLLEARLEQGDRIVLVFDEGEWAVPGDFIFKYGYSGSGPDCLHAFLEASGLAVSKSQIEAGKPGDVIRR